MFTIFSFFHIFSNIITSCNAEDQTAPDKWSAGGAVPGLRGFAAGQPVLWGRRGQNSDGSRRHRRRPHTAASRQEVGSLRCTAWTWNVFI